MKYFILFRPFRALYFMLHFWRIQPSPKYTLRESQAIVSVPFGTHDKGQSIGISNNTMVFIMSILHERYPNQKLIAQWEMGQSPITLPFDYLVGKEWDFHIDTRKFFVKVRQKFPYLKKITIIAHPDHVLRVALIAIRLGFEPVIPKEVEEIPYDPKSMQIWCRGPWKMHGTNPKKWGFMWWELLLARPYFVLKGQM